MKHSLRPLCVLCVLCILISLSPVVSAQDVDDTLEREAQAIDKMLMCPVCPAETIDQAQVEISFQMRAVVRELLAEGRTRQEVLDYFVDRYGADILAAPPKSGTNLVAWILPIVGVAAGLLGVFLVIRAMARSRPIVSGGHPPVSSPQPSPTGHQPPDTDDDPDLAPYLEIADRIIGSQRASASFQSPVLSPQPPATGHRPPAADEGHHSPQQDDPRG